MSSHPSRAHSVDDEDDLLYVSAQDPTVPGKITSRPTTSANAPRVQPINWMLHLRRFAVMALNQLCSNLLVLALIGLLNRLHPRRPIRTLFLVYPGNDTYLQLYVYPWYAKYVRWQPVLMQVLNHGRSWGLSFGITAMESRLIDSGNVEHLRHVHRRMERLKRIVGASQVTYSGILPGVMVKRGLMTTEQCPEIGNTAKVVSQAVDALCLQANLPSQCPVLVLGAKGTIGSQVVPMLEEAAQHPVYAVDIDNPGDFPEHLRGEPLIVLNIATLGALGQYLPLLWPQAVILNEVYPEPRRNRLGKIGCWHIAGVKGWALPAFHGAYANALPCCSAYLQQHDFEVVLKRIQ